MLKKSIPLFVLTLIGMGLAAETVTDEVSGYWISGRTVECRLVEYPHMPSGETFPPLAEGESRVSLRNYMWFPSPQSSPEVIVVVRDTSDFELHMLEVSEKPIDEFEFHGIEAGVYIFVLKEPVLPKRACTVRLVLDGVPAGEVKSRTHRSSYHW